MLAALTHELPDAFSSIAPKAVCSSPIDAADLMALTLATAAFVPGHAFLLADPAPTQCAFSPVADTTKTDTGINGPGRLHL